MQSWNGFWDQGLSLASVIILVAFVTEIFLNEYIAKKDQKRKKETENDSTEGRDF